jgi:hypothetical protein
LSSAEISAFSGETLALPTSVRAGSEVATAAAELEEARRHGAILGGRWGRNGSGEEQRTAAAELKEEE